MISSSYPDPRLWNNRVAAFAGTARSTGHLAVAGAMAVTEASIYGGQPILKVADFLSRTLSISYKRESNCNRYWTLSCSKWQDLWLWPPRFWKR